MRTRIEEYRRRERLTQKQNQGLGILVLGIALLGISEIIRALEGAL